MISIVLADDHSIVRSGLKKLVEQPGNIKVIKECANGLEVLEFVKTGEKIDIVISDLNMPEMNGTELTIALQRLDPSIKVIILSMYDDLNHVSTAFNAGANAYLLKSADTEELEFAVKMVNKNRKYMGIELIEKLIKFQINHLCQDQEPKNLSQYSERELQVLELIAEGLTNNEISNKLFLSKRTIEGHRQSLLQKTSQNNTASLIRYAIKNRLIT
ncbi:response regulator transcription factor [Pedobacter hiemivivus]|uniref:Response regulator transcription factor n=1 Tax=Pedobacter hiemivivus TaxID=2530454 RepID=A0A4R0MZD3_9SPHI|nr:response regulator transcription factor [Pedobacter hiemivivus]TCC92731.1 response regulator transcription factor [Pedobacter hiemivivus]TKC56202.1 response regulator transcription factor [Pedobacter hiemivivus]